MLYKRTLCREVGDLSFYVLILVLLENALQERANSEGKAAKYIVLILVLLENALQDRKAYFNRIRNSWS